MDLFNEDARLGARVLETAARLAALQKQARKTPARTLLVERGKVEAAKKILGEVEAELMRLLIEHERVRRDLGRTDWGLSDEYLAVKLQYLYAKAGNDGEEIETRRELRRLYPGSVR
jgi:hypothetical protein